MKICIISNLYEPYARGGAEVIVKRTAEELVKQGHQVTLITAKPWTGCFSLAPQVEVVEGLKIVRFYPLNIFFYPNDHNWPLILRAVWHVFDIFNFHSAKAVQNVLQEDKPDLVVTHNLMGLGYLIPNVIKKLKIKNIHVIHDIQLAVRSGVMKKSEETGWDKTGFASEMYRAVTRWLFQSPDVVVSPSKYLLNFYKERGFFPESKTQVVRNPIDEQFFRQDNITHEGCNFAYIGQLVEHKGLNVLKQAFAKIQEQQCKLFIVGDGPQRQEMSDWDKEDVRVTYNGKIPNQYLPDFLQTLDAVILPTLTYENSPTVVYEALACGVPVIVSDIGGAAELIEHGKNGFVVELGNSDDLILTMQKYISGNVDMIQMRQHARNSVQDFKVEDYVKKVLSLI